MSNNPFERDGSVDTPGLIGARWWQKQLTEAEPPANAISRRSALGTVLGVGAALAGVGLILAMATSGNDDDDDGPAPAPTPKPLLEVQKEYGWNFGARTEALTYDGVTALAFDAALVDTMPTDFAPASAQYLPYWSPTLFQSPTALPTKTAEADAPDTFKPLKEALRPYHDTLMDSAFARGRALAMAMSAVKGLTIVVDLPGPEAVAFAAGAAGLFDWIFTFENWPHPRGVVPAHRTLGAALYYQPLFRKKRADAMDKPPMIVLDRNRLAAYTSEATQFDNRWLAKLPTAANLTVMAASRVLYVTPNDFDAVEMDDVNDDVVAWDAAGLEVRMIGAGAFTPCTGKEVALASDDTTTPPYCYGGSVDGDLQLFVDYPWKSTAQKPKVAPSIASGARDWRPKARTTPHASGNPMNKPRPANFGTVPVMIAVGTGAYLGWRYHARSGSWNRAPQGGSGWGSG